MIRSDGLTFGDDSVENVFQFVGCDFHVLQRDQGGEKKMKEKTRGVKNNSSQIQILRTGGMHN